MTEIHQQAQMQTLEHRLQTLIAQHNRLERGFLAPGKTVGADIQHNIENSAMLYATAQHIKRDKMLNYAVVWTAYPQWSRYLTGARRAATSREVAFAVKNGVLDLPRTNNHLRDAIGLGMAAYYAARWEMQTCTP